MAFQFISPEIDPYIGAAIVIAIFGFIVYLISYFGKGDGGGPRGPPGPRGRRGGRGERGERGERGPQGPGITPAPQEPPAAQKEAEEEKREEAEEEKREVETAQLESVAEKEKEKMISDEEEAVKAFFGSYVISEEERRALERVKGGEEAVKVLGELESVRRNISFLLESAEIFFKIENGKLKEIEPKFMVLLKAIDSIKSSALKEAKIEEIILKEVDDIKKLLNAEIDSLQKRIYNDKINLANIYKGLKDKYQRAKYTDYFEDLEEKINQLDKELKINSKLKTHLIHKEWYIKGLIKTLLRLEEESKKLEDIGISLLEFEEKVEKENEQILIKLEEYKQLVNSQAFNLEYAKVINEFVCKAILRILKESMLYSEEVEVINKELFSITEDIQADLYLFFGSLRDSKESAKDFEKICNLEKNQNQRNIFDRIVKFDDSLAKRIHQSFKKIKEYKDSLHEQKEKIKTSIDELKSEIDYYKKRLEEISI